MENTVSMHLGTTIARTAFLIDKRKQEIDLYTRFLNGERIPGWENVHREIIVAAREYSCSCLSDLLSEDQIKLIKMDFDKIRSEYIK